jgi:predicted phage terminase large subunit-like protein
MALTHEEALKKALRERKKERLARRVVQRRLHDAACKVPDEVKPKPLARRLPGGWEKKQYEADPELKKDVTEAARALRGKSLEKTRARREKRLAKTQEERTQKRLVEIAEEETEREVNQARRELAQRELCRKYLIASILRFNHDYLAGWVHKDICVRLERFMRDIEDKKNPRLMLQMPPRHGKSTIASQEFPAWVLGHHPEWEIMGCSYAESLALDFSRAVRERLRDPEYHVLFKDTRIDRENQNAQGWKTTKKGGFLPAGVGGAITGKGAHILIIDDPVKNSQEAESETTRESIGNWYDSTAYTRLAPGGGVLVIQTRWHMDDLSGRLEYKMREGNGDVFEIVRYPAMATEDEQWRKKGEALHAARYDEGQLTMIRKAVGERTWSALYQQNPVPDEGAAFQQSMIQYYRPHELPEELTKVSTWDLAIGQKEVNDKTVGMTWGKDVTGQYWFVDCRRGHFDAMEIVDEICDNYIKHKPTTVGIEKDKVGQAVGSFLDTEIESRELYGLYIEELSPAREGNKLHRCRSLQGLMRRGKVFLPHPDDAPWVYEFVSELMQFPYGRRDDHVDAAAWLALMAADTPAPGLAYSQLPKRSGWRDRLRKLTRDSKTMMSS